MAKKARQKIWWLPVTKELSQKIQLTGRILPNLPDEKVPVLFDNLESAYAVAYANRFIVKRDENGEVITDANGYARLQDTGRIVIIGLRGQRLDWKQIERSQVDKQTDAIRLYYQQSSHKYYIAEVKEENDQMYYRAVQSPMAKAGGITLPKELIEYHVNLKSQNLSDQTDTISSDDNRSSSDGMPSRAEGSGL